MPKAFKQKCAHSLGKFIEAEHLRRPECIRECGNVPGGTPTLADVFRRNVTASRVVPRNIFAAEQIRYDTCPGTENLTAIVPVPVHEAQIAKVPAPGSSFKNFGQSYS